MTDIILVWLLAILLVVFMLLWAVEFTWRKELQDSIHVSYDLIKQQQETIYEQQELLEETMELLENMVSRL